MSQGWHKLIPSGDLFHGKGKYRIDAYSEFTPPPRLGWKPYGKHRHDPELFAEDDPYGWYVGEFEEAIELQRGLDQVGKQVIHKLSRLLDGNPNTGLPTCDLDNNPFWPAVLKAEPKLPHERCVTLLPLALSRTQDDKGRTRWTLFGNSEQGPGRAFWKGFFTSPHEEMPVDQAVSFFRKLLNAVYGEKLEGTKALHDAGFRILPDDEPLLEAWHEKRPKWTNEFLLNEKSAKACEQVKYLLTFRPFDHLPSAVQKAYLAGTLHLLPFPVSLVYWGVPAYHNLHKELPLALQIPLLFGITRHQSPEGLRVPQVGYLHEPNADHPHANSHADHVRNTYKRTHRWDKILRDQDELALISKEEPLIHVLFSTLPDDLTLYDKPYARNAQMWNRDNTLLLDGPHATQKELKKAMQTVQAGGLFGYRFQFPAMRVGRHEVYWHRPLVAYRTKNGEAAILPDAPLGYLTAYDAQKPRIDKAIELWPRFHKRPIATAAVELLNTHTGQPINPLLRGVRKLLDAFHKRHHKPLPRSLARQLIARGPKQSLDEFLKSLPDSLKSQVETILEPVSTTPAKKPALKPPPSLTYRKTATRAFEVKYWKTIAGLSEGTFLNKNNADCVRDEITQKILPYHDRHLEPLGDFLLDYYAKKIEAANLKGKALAGSAPFQWQTDFDYSWMGGWLKNQSGPAERNLIVMIPGRDRKRAVIMSDHYDTAYMYDRYDEGYGGCGARISACGADDNHSATAAMMLAAPIFLEMSRKGQLECDIWLVHLTGEEFPADSLGTRALIQRLVEGTLQLHLPNGKTKDLSGVEVRGLYVSDMIAHNNDRERDVFQITPGTIPEALWLAEQAHIAAETWNASVPFWNEQPERAGKQRGRRSPHGGAVPEVAPFLALSGEVRTVVDPRSTLFNTDGQLFSDAGVPCVLFMENYDIERVGYHDTHDTMENIDLEYGAAFCAITIESVARAATS